MAAAPGPREEAEERRRLLRAVTRLQAGVRGFLLRRRLRSVRAEYEEVVREIEGDLSELQWRGLCLPRPVFVPKKPMKEKCSAMQEAVSNDKDSTEKTQQEMDVSKPERDWGSSNSVKPTAQLQSEKELNSMEIPLVDVKELPRTRPGLQSFRNHLIMELLWLQQAIDSRKNYLKLKQRLESPDS